MDNAARLVTEAKRLFEESGQSHPAARAESRLAEIAFQQGHLDQAIDSVRHAHDVLAGEEPDAAFALVTGQFGRFLALSGNPEAGPVLEEALRLAEQLELREVYSQALSSRSVVIMREGRHDETVTLLRRALEVALEGDYTTAAFRAWNNLAVTLEGDDRYLEVVELNKTTLEMARRKGDRSSELAALLGYCAPLVALGRWDEAIAFADEAETAKELEAMGWASVRVGELVSVHVRRGETEAARQVFAVAKARTDEHNDEIRARVGCIEVELLNAEGRPAEAVSLAKQLLDLLPRLGLPDIGMKRTIAHGVAAALELSDLASAESMLEVVRTASPGLVTPSLRAHAARLSSRVCAQRGQSDSVEAGFKAAIAEFRDIEMPFELGVTLLELAEWLDGQGRREDATAFGLEALALFERLGARPWVERVQLVVASGGPGAAREGIRAIANS
jgi:tetratricopeptide (TPR) repeat protein